MTTKPISQPATTQEKKLKHQCVYLIQTVMLPRYYFSFTDPLPKQNCEQLDSPMKRLSGLHGHVLLRNVICCLLEISGSTKYGTCTGSNHVPRLPVFFDIFTIVAQLTEKNCTHATLENLEPGTRSFGHVTFNTESRRVVDE